MTAIAGSSAGVKDMADGSLRITVEFEPKDAKAAFELFGSRGTPVAMAALKAGYAAVQDEPEQKKVEIGPLCREAVLMCQNPAFRSWAMGEFESYWPDTEYGAKVMILSICGIESRKSLDEDEKAAQVFIQKFRLPFMRRDKSRQAA